MANEIKEAAINWSEKQLRLLKMYLPYVVMVVAIYGYNKKDGKVDELQKEKAEHLQKDLDFTRDAYQRSTEVNKLMIQNFKNEKTDQDLRR